MLAWADSGTACHTLQVILPIAPFREDAYIQDVSQAGSMLKCQWCTASQWAGIGHTAMATEPFNRKTLRPRGPFKALNFQVPAGLRA